MTGTTYKLTAPKVKRATKIGTERHERAKAKGRADLHGASKDDVALKYDILAAGAEMIVAHHLGMKWNPAVGALDKDGDVGPADSGIQVRSTPHDNGGLILHPSDNKMHYFVLVTGKLPRLTVVGWLLGGEGQEQTYWRSEGLRSPCYIVPPFKLRKLPAAGKAKR